MIMYRILIEAISQENDDLNNGVPGSHTLALTGGQHEGVATRD